MWDLKLAHSIQEKRIHDVFSRIISHETEHYKAVIMMGQSAIKSSLFINAGALVTVMAFFNANLASIELGIQSYVSLTKMLIQAMSIWLGNILICVMAYGLAYLSEQRSYVNFLKNEEAFRHAVIEMKDYFMPADMKSLYCGWTAWIFIAVTYILFAYSIYLCYIGFVGFVESF